MLTHGELFAGMGGFSKGFAGAGIRTVWAVEKDPFARRVLQHHYPDLLILEDVCEVGKHNLEPVDIVSGGFPCQNLSVAGKRTGLAGSQSGLFFEMIRIINELLPSVVVIENVPGLRSSPTGNNGRDFQTVLQYVAGIGLYECAWTSLDAQFFGLAQRRQRVFFVLTRHDLGTGRAAEILALAEGRAGHPAPRGQAGPEVAGSVTPGARRGCGQQTGEQVIASTLGSCGNGRGWNNDLDRSGDFVARTQSAGHGRRYEGDSETFVVNSHNSCAKKNHARQSDVARTLDGTGGYAPGQGGTLVIGQNGSDIQVSGEMGTLKSSVAKQTTGPLIAYTLRSEGCDASGDGTGRGTPLVSFNIVGLGQQGKNHAYESGVTGAIQHKGNSASGNEAGTLVVAFKESQSGTRTYDVHPTIDANKGLRRQEGVVSEMMVRRLTPTECLRLQGFPDDWLDLDPPLSDSAKYRLIGNAVAVPVARWIGGRIRE